MTETRTKPAIGQRAYTGARIEQRQIDEEGRTVDLAFSSETPVERWYGREVLSHDPGAMRAGRFDGSGASLLLEHDSRALVGKVTDARVDPDRVGRATARFLRGDLAEQTFQEVIDGGRDLTSVGYLIHDLEERIADDGVQEIRITDWEPLEVSLVAVPADASVGIGRSHAGDSTEGQEMATSTVAERDDNRSLPEGGSDTSTEASTDHEVSAAELRELEAQEAARKKRERDDAEIRELGGKYKLEQRAEELIGLGGTPGEMRAAVRLAIINRKPEPTSVSRPSQPQHVSGGLVRSKKLRAFKDQGEEVAYRMGMWGRAVLYGDQRAQRWCNEHGVRAMSEGVLTKGGATVPQEMSQAIIDLREDYGVTRQLARVVPMSSDTMQIPRRTGGVTAYFVGENTEVTASDKSWDNVGLSAKKLGALCKFSSELAEDSVIDVAEDLADEIAYAFAEKEDDCYFNGDGTSTYGGIYGLREKIIDGNHAAGAIDGASGIDTFAEVTQAELDNLMAATPAYALMGARWVGSQPAKALVWDSLAAAAGGTTMMMLGDRPAPAHLGYPITLSQKMPTSTGDLSNVAMLAFGNFMMASTMGDRRGFDVRLLTERYAELDQLAVVAFERFDIVWHDLGDGTTAGPVVCLIGE